VSLIVADMMSLQAEPSISDLSQTESLGRNYEVIPDMFALVSQAKIP
jgi:hypothetical protein